MIWWRWIRHAKEGEPLLPNSEKVLTVDGSGAMWDATGNSSEFSVDEMPRCSDVEAAHAASPRPWPMCPPQRVGTQPRAPPLLLIRSSADLKETLALTSDERTNDGEQQLDSSSLMLPP